MYSSTGVTVELGELLDNGFQLWGFDYPSYYKGEEKTAFEQKVVDHYRFRQIGQETPARFRHYFQTRVREIMPYYIQMYKLQEKVDKIEDPLESYNLVETFQQDKIGAGSVTGRTTDSTETETAETTESNTNTQTAGHSGKDTTQANTRKFSDTPQGAISNLDDYLTEATVENATGSEETDTTEQSSVTATGTATASTASTASGTSETTTQDSENMEYTLTRRGNIGVQPLGSEIRDIRNSFINIDLMVIEALSDLFLMIY